MISNISNCFECPHNITDYMHNKLICKKNGHLTHELVYLGIDDDEKYNEHYKIPQWCPLNKSTLIK